MDETKPEDLAKFKPIAEDLAVEGLITAAEYLMMFGDYRGPVELLPHEGHLVGPPKPHKPRR